jgi:hypothetical protein
VNEPQRARHDCAGAAEFLTLTMPHETATRLADQLADAAATLLRQRPPPASALPVLPEHNPHVAADLRKIRKGIRCRRSCWSAEATATAGHW